MRKLFFIIGIMASVAGCSFGASAEVYSLDSCRQMALTGAIHPEGGIRGLSPCIRFHRRLFLQPEEPIDFRQRPAPADRHIRPPYPKLQVCPGDKPDNTEAHSATRRHTRACADSSDSKRGDGIRYPQCVFRSRDTYPAHIHGR